MKHANRLALFLLLAAVLLLALCACAGTKNTTPTSVSAYKSIGAYTDLGNEKLSWEGLNALPKKYAGMPTDEARQVCVDFWWYVKEALWIPDARYDVFEVNEDGTRKIDRTAEKGQTYAGLVYVGKGTGSIYRMLDFMDPETGVLNITDAGRYPLIFGNMCSNGCFWAWARVMNSADYCWCQDSVASRGYIPVCPYTYDTTIPYFFDVGYGTDDICDDNGEQIIYQSYANMGLADGLISLWEKNGHTMMCTVAPHVEYFPDGTIDGRGSFLHITEQGGAWENGVSAQGRPFQYEYSKNKKFSFFQLYNAKYIPFTFADLIGTEPIEETEVSITHTGETITEKQLFSAKVTSNYNISDVYVMIYDKAGNEVYKHAVRARIPSTRELRIHKILDQSHTWGSWDNVKAGDTVKVEVLLGTGEQPLLWEGKLAE